jgi:hypothetical protein
MVLDAKSKEGRKKDGKGSLVFPSNCCDTSLVNVGDVDSGDRRLAFVGENPFDPWDPFDDTELRGEGPRVNFFGLFGS